MIEAKWKFRFQHFFILSNQWDNICSIFWHLLTLMIKCILYVFFVSFPLNNELERQKEKNKKIFPSRQYCPGFSPSWPFSRFNIFFFLYLLEKLLTSIHISHELCNKQVKFIQEKDSSPVHIENYDDNEKYERN